MIGMFNFLGPVPMHISAAVRSSVGALPRSFLIAIIVLGACTGCGGGASGGTTPGTGGGTSGNVPSDPPRVAGIMVVAGDASASGSNDGTGSTARFDAPSGIAVDGVGNLYVADTANATIRKIDPSGQVATLAGLAASRGLVDGTGGSARFSAPGALTIDASGNLFVTDANTIRKVSPAGVVTTVATIAIAPGGDSRIFSLSAPTGVAVAANGDLYVTNWIGTRRISAAGTTMLEGVDLAPVPEPGTIWFGTLANFPRGITIDNKGTVYVFAKDWTISKISPDGKLLGLAGNTYPVGAGSVDGTGSAATFSEVESMAADASGNIYVADNNNYADDLHLIRRITPAGVVSTLAGTRGATALQPGALPGSLARTRGIAVDKSGIIFATSGNAVIKVTPPQ